MIEEATAAMLLIALSAALARPPRFNIIILKLLPRVLIIACIPIIFGMTMLSLLAYLISAQEASLRREKEAYAAVTDAIALTTALTNSSLALFQYSTDLNEEDLVPYFAAKKKALDVVSHLKQVMAGRPNQLHDVETLERSCNGLLKMHSEAIWLVRLGGIDFAPYRLRELREQIQDITPETFNFAIEDLDKLALSDREKTLSRYHDLINLLLYGGAGAAVLMSFILPLLLSQQVTKRLNVILENSNRLARNAPLLPPGSGSDEITELDRQFHAMVAHLNEVRAHERAILDNAGAVIFILDQESKIKEVTIASEKIWGYSEAELLGQRISSLVQKDDIQRLRDKLQSVATGTTASWEQDIQKKDGSTAVMIFNIRKDRNDQQFYCVAHDVTERKRLEEELLKSEENLRLLVQNLPAGLMLLDANGVIRFANTSALSLLGNVGMDELIGKSIFECLSLEKDERGFAETVSKNLGKTIVCTAQNAIPVPVELTLDFAEIGGEKNVLAILVDITQRQAVDRIKVELLRTMTDEVALPVSIIANILRELEAYTTGPVQPKAKERNLSTIRESERLLKLFDDFINIRLNDNQMFTIVKKHVQLSELIDNAVSATAVKASHKGVKVTTEVKDATIDADPERIVQVIVNLLTNAIKFSPSGSEITIRGGATDDGALEITVSDLGPGIPDASLLHIFEPFKQVRITDATRKGGTGLGLAICKTIIESHGGTIAARNNTDAGATFTITLPS